MVGMDDHVAVIGDWVPSNPSPRTFFSSILSGDDFTPRSFSELLGNNSHNGLFEKQPGDGNKDIRDSNENLFSMPSPVFSDQKANSQGSLAERMAARAGFHAPTLNTEKIRSSNVSDVEVCSPYLTIPPGLSPTTLLDSPVFLSNSMAQPSPTTGKFFAQCSNKIKSSTLIPGASTDVNNKRFEDSGAPVAFRPNMGSSSSFLCNATKNNTSVSHSWQTFPNIEVSVRCLDTASDVYSKDENAFRFNASFPNSTNCSSSSNSSNNNNNNSALEPKTSSNPVNVNTNDSPLDGEGIEQQSPSRDFNTTGTSSDDGYNWRKYGQKQVKGSEYPRSYYKCTHPNCQVKKKVERSHEGHITEIIYKGAHSHPRPPPNQRSSDHPGAEGEFLWVNGSEWRHDNNLNATSLANASVVDTRSFYDSSSMQTQTQAQKGSQFENAIQVDASPNISNNDEEEDDRGTHGSTSLGCEGEGDESESKRRKLDAIELSGASRAIREPRVVVQTISEVDILDDGYRWRKYGQKVVKGNPNPRSYYKCTHAGCTVRKHVERASHDLKSVITTYEGKHNHDVPAARSNSHANFGTGPSLSSAQSRILRPEPSQIHNNLTRFDHGSTSLASFNRQQQMGHLGFLFGMGQPGLANLAMAGLGPGHGNKMPVHSYLAQQQHQVNHQMGYLLPKGEPKNEPIFGNNLNSGSIYHQIMSRLPQI